MKKSDIISIVAAVLAVAAIVLVFTVRKSPKSVTSGEGGVRGELSVAYFNLDRILQDYDMAKDLRSVAETKVEGINQEVNRRGRKLEKEIADFQDKMDKGLMTRSVAEIQGQKLQQKQNEFQEYAAQKQQEIAEEQAVMMNQIADAINTYVEKYNADKEYSVILTTQGEILKAPVVCGDDGIDVTEEILQGLNEEYVASKSKTDKK
ncbi:MAG: OmpH family outer membrane protein [Bacteroidales bacterium]|nr:OmpH family outer membrane protein [Bacteroidales bacterium]